MSSDDEKFTDNRQKPEMTAVGKDDRFTNQPKCKAEGVRSNHINGFSFSKSNLFEPTVTDLAEGSKSVKPSIHSLSGSSNARTLAKRPLNDIEPDQHSSNETPRLQSLLPPSPPADSSFTKGRPKFKPSGRKKARLVGQQDADGEESPIEDNHTKVREWSGRRRLHESMTDGYLEMDPILGLNGHDRSLNFPSADHPGTFEVDLPNDLRCMLAISPSKLRDVNEEDVVRGLLYGSRVGHYDGTRGGDIWDAGEVEDGTQSEEWEGEPVPWEEGEL